MRLILILLIAAIAFGVVQGMRHGCKFAFDRATYDCIMGRTAETTPTATETPAPAAEPAPTPAPAPAQ
jgi:hypothetical protein